MQERTFGVYVRCLTTQSLENNGLALQVTAYPGVRDEAFEIVSEDVEVRSIVEAEAKKRFENEEKVVKKLQGTVRADVIREREKFFNFKKGDVVRYKSDCAPLTFMTGDEANIPIKPRVWVQQVDNRVQIKKKKRTDVEKLLTTFDWEVIGPDPDPEMEGTHWILTRPRTMDTQHVPNDLDENIQIKVDITRDIQKTRDRQVQPLGKVKVNVKLVRRSCPSLVLRTDESGAGAQSSRGRGGEGGDDAQGEIGGPVREGGGA